LNLRCANRFPASALAAEAAPQMIFPTPMILFSSLFISRTNMVDPALVVLTPMSVGEQ
jgi:hypothetical protein